MQEQLKQLKGAAEIAAANSSYELRKVDTIDKAATLAELDHVIENTMLRSVQDYAIAKKHFFKLKGIK